MINTQQMKGAAPFTAPIPVVRAATLSSMLPPENPPTDYILYHLPNVKCQQLVDLVNGSSVLRPRIVCHEVTELLQAQPWFQRRSIKHVPALYDCKNPANTRFGTDAKEFIELEHKIGTETQNRQLVQAQNSRSMLPYQEVGAKLDEVLRRLTAMENDVANVRGMAMQILQAQQQQQPTAAPNNVKPFTGTQQRPGKPFTTVGTSNVLGGGSNLKPPRPPTTGLLLQKPSDFEERQHPSSSGEAFTGSTSGGGKGSMLLRSIRVTKDDTKSMIDVKTIENRRNMQLRQFKEKHGDAGPEPLDEAEFEHQAGEPDQSHEQQQQHEQDEHEDQRQQFPDYDQDVNDG